MWALQRLHKLLSGPGNMGLSSLIGSQSIDIRNEVIASSRYRETRALSTLPQSGRAAQQLVTSLIELNR